jgi:heptosyltransferase-2
VVSTVAVFWPNWVGDAVIATAAVRALRAHFANARFIGVLRQNLAGVVDGAPWLDELIFLERRGPSERRWRAVARRLRRTSIDLALLFPNSFHAAWVAWRGRCRRRVGYRRYGRGPLLTDALEPMCDARGQRRPHPALDAFNQLAEHVGAKPTYRLELFTTAKDEAAANAVWQQTRLGKFPEVICLNPGAAFGSAKHWPTESFAALARQLADQRGSGVLVLCGPGESELARAIVNRAGRPQVHALADHPLSLGLTKACVRRADLLITTDSGPRHFAAAFDRPVVTLFGPTHIAWTECYQRRALHLHKQVDCGPCQRRVCPLDHRCMKLLRPEEVFAAAERLLSPRRCAA